MEDYLQKLKNSISEKIPNFVSSLFIFLIFIIVAKIVKSRIIRKPDINNSSKTVVQNQIANLVYNLILIIGIIFAVINLGFNITSIITILASIGLAFGIAMQGTLVNIISGVIISMNNLYDVNDVIRINQLLHITPFSLKNGTLNSKKNIITPIRA
jgi:small conductance mechanosensitive channel